MNAKNPESEESKDADLPKVNPFLRIPRMLGLDIMIDTFTLGFYLRLSQWKIIAAFAILPVIPIFLNLGIPEAGFGILGIVCFLLIALQIQMVKIWGGEKDPVVDRKTYLRVLSGAAIFLVAILMASSFTELLIWYSIHSLQHADNQLSDTLLLLIQDPLRMGALLFVIVLLSFVTLVFPVWLVTLAQDDLPNFPVVRNDPMFLATKRMWKSGRFLRTLIPIILISISPIHLVTFKYLPEGYSIIHAYGFDTETFHNDPWYALLYQTNIALHTMLYMLLVTVLGADSVIPEPTPREAPKPPEKADTGRSGDITDQGEESSEEDEDENEEEDDEDDQEEDEDEDDEESDNNEHNENDEEIDDPYSEDDSQEEQDQDSRRS